MIRLQTLGVLDLRNAEGFELRTIVAQPKRLALLAYLAVAAPRGFHRRDSILSLFWPERDLEHGRASLSRAIYFLRRELGPGIVLSRGNEELGLDCDRIWCDAAAFENALQKGQDRDAFELYRGELLPGFFVSEASGFEAWLETQRARLRDSASAAVWRLAEQEEAAGNFAAAAQLARRGVELAPFREAAFRQFLALLDRIGDRAGAAHAYAKFADEIARELDVAPSPETRMLIDAIKRRAETSIDRIAVGARDPIGAAVNSNAPDETRETPPARPDDAITTAPVRRRRFTTRSRFIGAGLVAGVAIVSIALVATKKETIDPLRVDVAPWVNRTGDHSLDHVGSLAAERVIAALQQAGVVKDARILRGSSADRAGTLVTGEFDRAGGTLRFHAAITDVRRGGKPWALAPIVAPVASPEQAIDSARSRVLGAIAVLRHPTYASLLPLASPPPTFDAFHEFLEGDKQRSEGRIVDALHHYRWAAAIDSSFTWSLVHAGIACLNWYRGDMTAHTDSLLMSLRLVHGRLTPLQSHLVDYVSAVKAEDWVGSYRAMRAAAELAPYQYGLAFADQANQVNRPREAVDALTRAGMDSIHRRSVQIYWRRLTYSLHGLGEHQNELAMARRAREIDRQSAIGMLQELRALAALGQLAAVSAGLDTLIALPREDWLTSGYAAMWAAKELRAHGYGDAASETMQRAIAWYRSRPAEEQAGQEWREWFADLLYLAGDWTAADTAYRSLVKKFPTSAGYPDNALYVGRIGAIAARRSNVVEAKAMSEKLRATDRFQPRPGQESRLFRARIAALLGDSVEALRLLTSAYGQSGTLELHDDMDFEGMKGYAPFREFLRPKG